ncbi:MAG: hypothetical protein VKJ09_06845 [Leptolyngbya sp.]|nr:hypothetical protein [Leptolyngbya sp.]
MDGPQDDDPMTTPDPQANPDTALEQEIRAGRTYSMAEAIGRAGGDFLKGESTLPRLVRAQTLVNGFISQHLADVSGALHRVLHRWVQADTARLSRHSDQPLHALVDLLDHILSHPPVLYDLVWQVDMCWGELSGEPPHFQQPGQPPHPDDEYTHESVRQRLVSLREIAHQTLHPPAPEIPETETEAPHRHPLLRWLHRLVSRRQ